ncbi:MAG: signal peptidase I [Mogibacterium sp.]|nr:signal peptidase I [Mogibacterium sp.]
MFRQNKSHQSIQSAPDPEHRDIITIQKKARLVKRLRQDAVVKSAVFIAGIILSFTFVFGITSAPTNDMFPAVHEGDMIIYFRPGRIVNTDIVIYEAPDGSRQIGRVEGTEGESVGKSDGGLLTVNGNIQPVQKRSGLYYETYAGRNDISGEIGSGKYLILGDQREKARDSRAFGLIPRKAIKGKAFTIVRRRPL